MKTLQHYGELLYPYAFGLAATLSVWFFFTPLSIPKHMCDLFTNGVNLGGIAVGFMGATIALIYSLQDSYVIKRLKELSHFTTFISYFHQALFSCLFLTLIGMVGFLFDFESSEHGQLHRIYFAVWAGVLVNAGLCAFRFIWAFSRVLQIGADDPEK